MGVRLVMIVTVKGPVRGHEIPLGHELTDRFLFATEMLIVIVKTG